MTSLCFVVYSGSKKEEYISYILVLFYNLLGRLYKTMESHSTGYICKYKQHLM